MDNNQPQYISVPDGWGKPSTLTPSVEDAQQALKEARKVEKAARKERKRAERDAAQRADDHELGLVYLRDIAAYGGDTTRLHAAQMLINRGER